MTATPEAPEAPTLPYTIHESPGRVFAVDENDIELCGAFRPAGHETWTLYVTDRISVVHQHLYARTQQAAAWYVELMASMFTGGNPRNPNGFQQ